MDNKNDKKTEIHITNNFNAPVGQHIDHVDKILFSMDGDGTFHFENVDSMEQVPQTDLDELSDEEYWAMLGKTVKTCGDIIWGNAAMSVIYCVCRDAYKRKDSAASFERAMMSQGIDCPLGTVSNAMRNNPFLKLEMRKWKANGAKLRVLNLARVFMRNMELERQKQRIPNR